MSEDQHLNKPLTTTASASASARVGDNQSSLTLGNHGPIPIQDWQQAEKLAHQNHERI